MNIASRILKLSHKKQILLFNRLQSDFGLPEKDDLRINTTDKNLKYLVAYVVLKDNHQTGSDVEVSKLQVYLRSRLPDYMIPSSFTFIEKLPRNTNGKIDYHALPNPKTESSPHELHLDSLKTATERELKKIWALALGVDEIGAHDNFFSLGGHSLLVANIVSEIRSTFGVKVPLRALFEHPTLVTLGEAIDTMIWAKNQSISPPKNTSSDRENFEI